MCSRTQWLSWLGTVLPSAETPIQIPEPDLSMEVLALLKRSFSEMEFRFTQEEAAAAKFAPAEEALQAVRFKYACGAVAIVVSTLRSCNPEFSNEELMEQIWSVVHSESVIGHLGRPFKSSLRDNLSHKSENWLTLEVEKHIKISRRGDEQLPDPHLWFTIMQSPIVQRYVVSSFGCIMLLSIIGCTCGFAFGASLGAAFGASLVGFTFGFSLPIGLLVGGICGACTGLAAGTIAGFFLGILAGIIRE